ncbi:transcription initiation factor TFIID subunit 5-like [Daphnia pulicaria]|uniref:transcription initiation factor TFIID subunit 5-like n=1 Tax=Daphnia pulicaria TaxID=35523 RepID=UPI001EEA4D7C|nr:transcription initiation factor TFIID subunit 5-like [Daphnia pulicaria]XP_046638556.1 transcription initiation factor TFIID subunit 5-like [Daphnia pulicaria]
MEKAKTRILSQHSARVNSLSFSPDGRFLASADTDGILVIWSTKNWESVFTGEIKGRGCSLSWMSPSADVRDYKLTFDSSDGKVRVAEFTVGQSQTPTEGSKTFLLHVNKSINYPVVIRPKPPKKNFLFDFYKRKIK